MLTISKHSAALILLFLVAAVSTATTSTTNIAASGSVVSSSISSTMSNTTNAPMITVSANSTTTAPSNSTTTTTSSTTNATTTSVNSTTTLTTPNVSITVDSYPHGAELVTVDGNLIVTPTVFSWQVGSIHTLSANSSIDCGPSCQWVFQAWTDGGGQTDPITVSNSTTVYVAVYQQQGTVQSFFNTTTYTTSTTTFSTSSASTTAHGPDFALSVAPSMASLPPNVFVGSTVFTLTLTSISGWRGGVQFTTSQLPPGVTLSNMPSTCSSDTSYASWNVEVNIAASAQAGSYQIEITATSGSLIHTALVSVEVQGSTVQNLG